VKKSWFLFLIIITISLTFLGCSEKQSTKYTQNWQSLIVDKTISFVDMDVKIYSDFSLERIKKSFKSDYMHWDEKTQKNNRDKVLTISDWNKLYPFEQYRIIEDNNHYYKIPYFSKKQVLFIYFDKDMHPSGYENYNILNQKDIDKIKINQSTLDEVRKIDPSTRGSVSVAYNEKGIAEFTKHFFCDGSSLYIGYKFDRTVKSGRVVCDIDKSDEFM